MPSIIGAINILRKQTKVQNKKWGGKRMYKSLTSLHTATPQCPLTGFWYPSTQILIPSLCRNELMSERARRVMRMCQQRVFHLPGIRPLQDGRSSAPPVWLKGIGWLLKSHPGYLGVNMWWIPPICCCYCSSHLKVCVSSQRSHSIPRWW